MKNETNEAKKCSENISAGFVKIGWRRDVAAGRSAHASAAALGVEWLARWRRSGPKRRRGVSAPMWRCIAKAWLISGGGLSRRLTAFEDINHGGARLATSAKKRSGGWRKLAAASPYGGGSGGGLVRRRKWRSVNMAFEAAAAADADHRGGGNQRRKSPLFCSVTAARRGVSCCTRQRSGCEGVIGEIVIMAGNIGVKYGVFSINWRKSMTKTSKLAVGGSGPAAARRRRRGGLVASREGSWNEESSVVQWEKPEEVTKRNQILLSISVNHRHRRRKREMA